MLDLNTTQKDGSMDHTMSNHKARVESALTTQFIAMAMDVKLSVTVSPEV
jgi:hypothetical protein